MLEGKGEVKAEQGVTAATWLTQPRCLLRLMPKEDVFTFIVVKIRSGKKNIYIYIMMMSINNACSLEDAFCFSHQRRHKTLRFMSF